MNRLALGMALGSIIALVGGLGVLPGGPALAQQMFTEDGQNIKGPNVTVVHTTETWFTQTSPKTWQGLFRQDQSTFELRETSRDEWSVYLIDDSKGSIYQFDLYRRMVSRTPPGLAKTDIGVITAASKRPLDQVASTPPPPPPSAPAVPEAQPTTGDVTGRTVTRVRHDQGRFEQIGPRRWGEFSADGTMGFEFEEVRRDDSSVYLNDPSRNVQIQIDLAGNWIRYGVNNQSMSDLYTIRSSSSQPNFTTAQAPDVQPQSGSAQPTVTSTEPAPVVQNGQYEIRDGENNWCLTAPQGEGLPVAQWECSGGLNQKVQVESVGANKYRLKVHNRTSGAFSDCLLFDGSVHTGPCRDDAVWRIKDVGAGYLIITSDGTGCLEVGSNSNHVSDCRIYNRQRFSFSNPTVSVASGPPTLNGVVGQIQGDGTILFPHRDGTYTIKYHDGTTVRSPYTFSENIKKALQLNNPRGEYVRLPHTSLLATSVSGLAKDHVNGMAIMGNKFILNYPSVQAKYGNVIVYNGSDIKRHVVELDDSGWPSGMQASEDFLAVAMPTHNGEKKSLKLYQVTDSSVELKRSIAVQTDKSAEFVGFAKVNNGLFIIITPHEIYTASSDLNFQSMKIDGYIKQGEAGIALLNGGHTGGELVFLTLGTDLESGSFNYAAYSLREQTDGKFEPVLLYEGALQPPSNHSEFGSAASFRWGGTARIKGQKLEIFAAPKRIDAAGHASDLVKWVFTLPLG